MPCFLFCDLTLMGNSVFVVSNSVFTYGIFWLQTTEKTSSTDLKSKENLLAEITGDVAVSRYIQGLSDIIRIRFFPFFCLLILREFACLQSSIIPGCQMAIAMHPIQIQPAEEGPFLSLWFWISKASSRSPSADLLSTVFGPNASYAYAYTSHP